MHNIKIKFIIPFLFLLFLFTTSLSFAATKLKKYDGNPVLPQGQQGDWDGKGRLIPTVIFDEGVYKMWFAGFDGTTQRLGYATSKDGIIWDIYTENPVLEPILGEELLISENSVIRDGNKYKMWFTTRLVNYKYEIRYAYSYNGIEWFRQDLFELNTQKWESNENMFSPTVVKKDNEYIMLYNAVQDDHWKIGYASSSDGITWSKNPNPVIEATEGWEGDHTGRPWLIYHSDLNTYEVFYHASDPTVIGHAISKDGINWIKDENSLFGIGPQSFDSRLVLSPSVVVTPDNSQMLMYYTGYDGLFYSIGLATLNLIPTPSVNPVILLPGLFGSWNSKAILEGEDVAREEWVTTPFVKDYQGIIETLKSVGYSDDPDDQNQNLFVFNYDWRDRVEDTAALLNQFIDSTVKNKNPNKKIFLVGHSLGGLIGRTYLQNNGDSDIEQLITLGTPHSGIVQAYKAWEGGEIENSNPWEKLALEIILGINRNGFRTNKDTIREIAPVTHDLLPIFDFLKDNNDQIIPFNTLVHQNTWLNNLENNFSSFFEKFYSIYGEKGQTPEWYKVTEANLIEKLLGLWQDGKPIETLTISFGDETVLSKSATRSGDPAYLLSNINHRELVTNEDSLSELMNQLKVEPEAIITPPPSPPIFPSLFFAILSPAEFSVSGLSRFFESDENGLVFIPNALSGEYQINVIGKDTGKYSLIIGELGTNGTSWKEIIETTAPEEVDKFTIIYDSNIPPADPLIDENGLLHLNNSLEVIEKLKEKYSHWSLNLSQSAVKSAKRQLGKEKYKNAADWAKKAIGNLFSFRKRQTLAEALNLALEASQDLSFSYEKLMNLSRIKPDSRIISAEITLASSLKIASFEKLKAIGSESGAASFQSGERLLEKAQESFKQGNYYKAEIEAYIAKLLFLEV